MTSGPGASRPGLPALDHESAPVGRVVTIAVLVGAAYMFPLYLVGALGPQVRRDLDLGPTQLGSLVSVFFGTSAVLLVAGGGRLVDRMGPRRSVRVSVVAAATCLMAVAVLGGSYPGLLVAMVLGGVASMVAAPVGGMVISRVVPTARRSMAFAVERSSIPAATLVAGLCVPTLAVVMPWRAVFALAAVLALSILLVPVPDLAEPASAAYDGRLRPLLPILLVTSMFVLGSAAAISMSTFLVDYGVSTGISAGAAGLLLALTSAATIGVRLALGVIGQRAPGRATGAVLLIGGVAGFLLLAVPGHTTTIVGAVLAGAAGWGWTGIIGVAVVQSHPTAPGAATALVQAGGCVGGIVGPLTFGLLVEGPGFRAAWWCMAGLVAVAAAVAIVNRGIWAWLDVEGVDPRASAELSSERTAVTDSGTQTEGRWRSA
ncbi:MFS transporter [Nocardioides hwasunensis]|uniref:MFS transporter n=1 Tax=Nocardioides hwasunensis TaxID=397258 RepID=A0ABR8MJF5_9ACTN|nr:MFS transporter [Nocardioides hwasunensis]MBD3915406.1 MFS transporter [Nocardioides hwasunensis]